ncbi:MAG: SCO family protein, partial [Gammaproteobacteria bacterium]|nr:SCO family protein [Gammaproteobacteria bacterium]
MHRRTGILFLTLVAVSAFGTEYDRSAALDISQGAIGRQLDNYTLRDTEGQPFPISELRGKPLVVSMIYTSCHHICPTITRNLRGT